MVKKPEQIAAIDLGSNSFHMVVGRLEHGEIRLTEGISEKVQLGAGLDSKNRLTEATLQKALECLGRFAQRICGIPRGSVRVVGTNTLRMARNSREFIERAEYLLGHDIEIVSGREEARLIYLGVAHSLADDSGKRLVIDIGGGSTEFIIGERFEAVETESLHMGCVSYTQRFFANGKLKEKAFRKAAMAARQEVLNIENNYRKQGWVEAVGASGTIKAIEQVCVDTGLEEQGITRESLYQVQQKLLEFESMEQIDLPGLRADRVPIFPAGVAILTGIFEQLDIDRLTVSSGALREGLLYDLLGRFSHEDVRDRTVQALMDRYHVDRHQADRVAQSVLYLYQQVSPQWVQADAAKDLLRWAACLHETGLAVSHSQFHKHGGYVLQHSDLPGFSRQEQAQLATMVRFHRRKLQAFEQDSLVDEDEKQGLLRLVVLLRIAVLLHHARSGEAVPAITIQADENKLRLAFPAQWLDLHPLTQADFEQEKQYCESVGIQLKIRQQKN